MTIETEANITLTVEDHASSIVRGLRRDFDALTKSVAAFTRTKMPSLQTATQPRTASRATEAFTKSEAASMASLRRRWAFEGRMSRQRADEIKAGERGHRLFEAGAVRDLRERMNVAGRFARQRAAEAQGEDRQRRAVESAAMAGIRRQMASAAALARQRITETRSAERERQRASDTAERDASSALRRQIAGHRYLLGLRQRQDRQGQVAAKARSREEAGGQRDIGLGFSRAGASVAQGFSAAKSLAITSAVAEAAVGKAMQSSFASRMKVEAAETNLRMFGGVLARPGQAAKPMSAADVAEIRSTWLDEASVSAGVAPDVGIKTYTEVLKAGVASDRAREMTELVLTASAGMDMNAAETTRVMGRMATVMGGKDGVSGDRMSKIMSGMAIAASETAANPDEIVSGMNRGMSALAYGMSPEDLAAWVATGASTGIQAAKTGNFISTLLQNGVGAKNQRGQKLKDMDTAAQMVGLGNAQGMSRSAAKDPNAFLETMFERVERLSVEKRAKFSRLMGGQEWDDEILQMKQGLDTLKKTRAAIKDERNQNFLDDNKDLKNASLSGLWARMKSRFSLLWESFGHGFSDTFSEVATWFIASGRAVNLAGLRSVGASLMTGIVNGLGFTNWTALLNRVFGPAGKTDWGAINQGVSRFAEGFGAGIRSLASWAKGFLGIVGGDGFDAKSLGKVTAGILGLAFGLTVLAPVVGLFGIAAGGLRLLAGGVTVLNGALAAMSLGGLTGAGAKILGRMGFGAFAGGAAGLGLRAAGAAALAGLTIVGGGLLIAGLAGIAAISVAVANWDAIKGWFGKDKIEDRINEQQGGNSLAYKIWGWFKGNETVTVQRQSFGGYNGAFDQRAMIQNAAFSGQDRPLGAFRGFDGAQIVKAALTSPGTNAAALMSMGAPPGAGASPSFPGIGGATGSRAGGGPAVPGWFGRNGGNGTISPTFKGNQKAIAKTAFEFFRGKGLSAEAASGILASMDAESSFNPAARGDGGKAHGLFQHHADRRAAILRATGIDMSTASPEKQLEGAWWEMNHGDAGARRALGILKTPGISARDAGAAFVQHFERPAKDERAVRGSMAEGFNREFGAGGTSAASNGIPGLGAGRGQYEGLRIKGDQAIGGGGAHVGVTDMARQAQENLPGGVKHFGAFNDQFHHGRNSKHNQGLAFDTSLMDPSQSGAAAEAMRAKIRAAGLNDDAFRVIDEYRNPSAHSTGGHLHTQFNTKEAAQRYHAYVEGLMKAKTTVAGSPGAQDAADIVRAGQGFGGAKTPSVEDLASKVPAPAPRGAGGVPGLDAGGTGFQPQGGNGRSVTVHAPVTIHTAHQAPQEMAGHIQKHITEAWNFRSHDLEPELT